MASQRSQNPLAPATGRPLLYLTLFFTSFLSLACQLHKRAQIGNLPHQLRVEFNVLFQPAASL